MYLWSDMSKVKKDLWNKLHQVKNAVKDSVTNLAQIMVSQAQKVASNLPRSLQTHINRYYTIPGRTPRLP